MNETPFLRNLRTAAALRVLLALFGWSFLLSGVGCSSSAGPDQLQAESYEHIRASWSPDGSRIAFSGRVGGVQGIHLVDTTGRYVRLVKEGEGIGVAWSPDAQWLAYAAQQNLFMVRVTGDSSVQLTIRSGAIRPAWSPKRDTIAFVRTGIWLIDLKTREEWELSTTGNFPSWLPDGSGVVVLTSLSAIRGIQYSFEVCDLVSRQLTTLYEFLSASSCGFCSINSRGDAIVFSAKAYDAFAEVWVVDLVSRTPKRLTDDGGDYPAWSPDARSIVYTRTQPGDGGLWIMDADGANKRRLTAPD